MGYCGSCGKPVERGRRIGYDTETGEPIYLNLLFCKDCGEELNRDVASRERKSYESELKEIRGMQIAGIIDIGTVGFMEKGLKKRYNIKEFWE